MWCSWVAFFSSLKGFTMDLQCFLIPLVPANQQGGCSNMPFASHWAEWQLGEVTEIIEKKTHLTWRRRRRPQMCCLLPALWRQVRARASLCARPSWRVKASVCCGGLVTPPTELPWRPRPPSGRPGESRRGAGPQISASSWGIIVFHNTNTHNTGHFSTSLHHCPFHLQPGDLWHVPHSSPLMSLLTHFYYYLQPLQFHSAVPLLCPRKLFTYSIIIGSSFMASVLYWMERGEEGSLNW